MLFFSREELFENLDSGASQDAIKVLLLITDGDASDWDRYGIIGKYEQKKITRFVIIVSFSIFSIYLLSRKTITWWTSGINNPRIIGNIICQQLLCYITSLQRAFAFD